MSQRPRASKRPRRAERRQVGADVGVLVEGVNHLRSVYVEAMEAVHDRAVGRPGVVGHAAVEEAMNTFIRPMTPRRSGPGSAALRCPIDPGLDAMETAPSGGCVQPMRKRGSSSLILPTPSRTTTRPDM